MADNIIDFLKKSEEISNWRRSLPQRDKPVVSHTLISPTPIVNTPTDLDIAGFIRVMNFFAQMPGSDGTGNIDFDEFAALITIDRNRIDVEDDDPQVHIATVIEAVIPLFYSIKEEDKRTAQNCDEASIDDLVILTRDVLEELQEL